MNETERFMAAKSYLSHYAWERTGADMRINPALMKVSVGTLPLSNDRAVEKTDTGPDFLPMGPQDKVAVFLYFLTLFVAAMKSTDPLILYPQANKTRIRH